MPKKAKKSMFKRNTSKLARAYKGQNTGLGDVLLTTSYGRMGETAVYVPETPDNRLKITGVGKLTIKAED